MPTVRLPRDCYAADLIVALGDAGVLGGGDGLVILHFPERSFIHTAAIAFLCAWGRQETARGRELRLQGDAETLGYLARMDLHEHLGLPYERGRRHSEEGRFLPLRQGQDDRRGSGHLQPGEQRRQKALEGRPGARQGLRLVA